MKIKKLLTVFIVLMLAGSFAACGRGNEKHRETESAGQSNISSKPSQKVEMNQSEGTEQGNILIAYFSRFGNTGYPDDIDTSTSASVVLDGGKHYGTTEYIAGIIRQSVGGELHLIETKDSYPEDFNEVTEKNHDGYGAGSSYGTVEKASRAGKCLGGLAVEAEDVLSAQEIKSKFPLTVSMSGYGGGEYYGGIEFIPKKVGGGQLHFENGDITYCETNNSMAIFYAQTDHPDLTMEVIPIGKVTSDLSVFDTFDSSEDITFTLSE